MLDDCKDCQKAALKKHYPIYNLKCESCRDRMLMSEPCKLLRKYNASFIERFGTITNWKREPSCGCETICKRKANMKKQVEPEYY